MFYNNTAKEVVQFVQDCIEVYEGNVDRGFWERARPETELSTLVITELMEAVEADRKGRRANTVSVSNLLNSFCPTVFKNVVKDSVEDEVADAAIRCMDYIGHIAKEDGIAPVVHFISARYDMYMDDVKELQVPALTYATLCESLGSIAAVTFTNVFTVNVGKRKDAMRFAACNAFLIIQLLSYKYDLNLENHVRLKLQYNATRPYKHGKKY